MKKEACPHCGRVPRYYGRLELLRLIKHWEHLARNAHAMADWGRLAFEMRRVIDETEKSCVHCNTP